MGTNKVARNVDGELAFASGFSQTEIGIVENKTDNSSYNDTTTREIALFSSTAFPFTTPVESLENLDGDSSSNRFQYYIIGVYAFFVGVFVLAILIVIVTKLYKACCTESRDDEYDAVHYEGQFASDATLCIEHHVDIDQTDVETHQEHDSDYDYYSDVSNGDTEDLKEKPPDYEEPPSYDVVQQTSIHV